MLGEALVALVRQGKGEGRRVGVYERRLCLWSCMALKAYLLAVEFFVEVMTRIDGLGLVGVGIYERRID